MKFWEVMSYLDKVEDSSIVFFAKANDISYEIYKDNQRMLIDCNTDKGCSIMTDFKTQTLELFNQLDWKEYKDGKCVDKSDRLRICYLLDNENPLEVGEKFDLPNCDEYNPYYIDEKGIIRDCMNGFIGYYDVRMFFDCINGKSHIQRLPQYPDFSDTEVEALKWFHKHFGTELKAYTDGDTAVFGLYKFTLVPAILFPHLKEYIQGNSLDVNKYLKWREENNAN